MLVRPGDTCGNICCPVYLDRVLTQTRHHCIFVLFAFLLYFCMLTPLCCAHRLRKRQGCCMEAGSETLANMAKRLRAYAATSS